MASSNLHELLLRQRPSQLDMVSEGTELPSRPQSTLQDDNLANAASPVSSTETRSARGIQARNAHGTGSPKSSDPYVAFLKETFHVSDSGYVEVLRWCESETPKMSINSWARSPDHVVYECLDFCPSPADEPQSLITTFLHGPINSDLFKMPAVDGVLRIIIVEMSDGSRTQVMNDAGNYFRLPPCVFAPFIDIGRHEVTSRFLCELYAEETLIFRVGGHPVVVQPVVLPGSEATTMTCCKTSSWYAFGADAMQSSFCPEQHCPSIFCVA